MSFLPKCAVRVAGLEVVALPLEDELEQQFARDRLLTSHGLLFRHPSDQLADESDK